MKIITYMLLYDSNKEYEIYANETMIIIIGIPSFNEVTNNVFLLASIYVLFTQLVSQNIKSN